ncbi:hypothetical protein P4H67_16045 [Paenibacillus lautus]|uniref:hypothetical protein n=1 Tax=Paenibacillus lautus TaxID=1401 RepID=UPI002DB61953|nr:hypothetical protein [Paenibacillus lautus]MEC0308264.1 hypothetical protein [Paenibacillus lautus]
MNNIQKFIKLFKLNVIHVDGVPESYSSEVYRLTLSNQQQVYLKIPFNKGGGSFEIDFTKVNRYIWERNPATREIFEEGYNSIKTLIDLKRTLPFYSLYDSFCGVAWCAKRGIDKHKAFLNENLDELKRITNSLDEMNI